MFEQIFAYFFFYYFENAIIVHSSRLVIKCKHIHCVYGKATGDDQEMFAQRMKRMQKKYNK